jgi:DNA-binding transcriptional regulator YhcF (GntR family)
MKDGKRRTGRGNLSDKTNPESTGVPPLHEEIAVDIRRMIDSGALPMMQFLPQADLAERYGTSRSTIRKAIRALDADGLVETVPGAGARVIGRTRSLAFVPDLSQVRAAGSRSPAQSRSRGISLRIAAWLMQFVGTVLVFGIVVSAVFAIFYGRHDFVKFLLVLISGFALYEIGHLAVSVGRRRVDVRGRQHLSPILSSPDQLAGKPFVLYLRSFSNDSDMRRIEWIGIGDEKDLLINLRHSWRTDEEQLVAALQPVGQVVALGHPGEQLPMAGARRLYCTQEAWQDTVVYLMERARLVVLWVGTSSGLMWELSQALFRMPPTRVVLIVNMEPRQYVRFQHTVAMEFDGAARQLRRMTGQQWHPPVLPGPPGEEELRLTEAWMIRFRQDRGAENVMLGLSHPALYYQRKRFQHSLEKALNPVLTELKRLADDTVNPPAAP